MQESWSASLSSDHQHQGWCPKQWLVLQPPALGSGSCPHPRRALPPFPIRYTVRSQLIAEGPF